MTSRTNRRTGRFCLPALMLLLSTTAVHGQESGAPTQAHRRAQCRLVAQVLETGHPDPRYEWALDRVRFCPNEAGAALASVWRSVSPDSAGLVRLIGVTERLSDRTTMSALLEVAGNPDRPRVVRFAAVAVLAAYADSTAVVKPAHLADPAAGVVGSRVDFTQTPGASPLTPTNRAQIVAVLRDIGESDGDLAMRAAASAVATELQLRLASALAITSAQGDAQDTIPLRPGMVITRSVVIAPGTYALPATPDLDAAILTVRGTDITVDLSGVRLLGTPITADPDQARGVAIRVEGGRNITIRGATIRGYKFAILAIGTRNLTLADNELSHNWKPRLFSLVEHESLVDWLSFHRNEAREWMRFGAAIYLEDVRGGTISGNRATQGMNALLMVRSDSLVVRDNTFAFNSGLGVGLYRSSGNTIVRNRVDFNVRGYSHGFYRRGQDSAGILLYEQSMHNVVAWNSATHSGDGLFLWAGQHTMDTGEGGANDNLFVANDFSFAPTNGMEATFSRNRFVGNRAEGNDYGLWGGYSWESDVIGNCFIRNRIGVAIEHGQENTIRDNTFFDDSTAIQLWANPVEPLDWGYPKHRDTDSRDYVITGNRFVMNPRIWNVKQTAGLDTAGNDVQRFAMSDDCMPATPAPADLERAIAALPDTFHAIPRVPLARADRSVIIVDEWGPFDWRSPKLWPIDTTRATVPLRTVGLVGRWRVVDQRGVESVSPVSGRMGDTIVVTPMPSPAGGEDWRVELEYTGGETVWPNGERAAAGTPVRFSYERLAPEMQWNVRFFAWADSTRDPLRDSTAFASLLGGTPLLTRDEPRLDYMWYRPRFAELPQERWALEATATVTLGDGDYSLRTISDDAIRVWVDGALVIDHWAPHESAVAYAEIAPGRHELRVQYYQVGGWSEVRVEVVRGSARSMGSAGPH